MILDAEYFHESRLHEVLLKLNWQSVSKMCRLRTGQPQNGSSIQGGRNISSSS